MPYQDRPEPWGPEMARKPKTASSNEPAASIDAAQPALSDTAAPVRRGRKPKTVGLPEPLAMMDSDDAVGGTVDADGSIAEPIAAPVRKRPGPKPKQQAGAAEAAPLQSGAAAKPGRKARAPDATLEPTPTADSIPTAEVEARQQQAHDHESATLETTPAPAASDAAPTGSGQNMAISAKPAAHWDRATDTVRFEWAEIEQTAAQDGPNQAMAKLLVAARAEGANSRWPL